MEPCSHARCHGRYSWAISMQMQHPGPRPPPRRRNGSTSLGMAGPVVVSIRRAESMARGGRSRPAAMALLAGLVRIRKAVVRGADWMAMDRQRGAGALDFFLLTVLHARPSSTDAMEAGGGAVVRWVVWNWSSVVGPRTCMPRRHAMRFAACQESRCAR